jgi:RecA-family ATPase
MTAEAEARKLAQEAGHQFAAANGSAPAVTHRLVLTPASKITPRPVRWGWDDRLPASHVGLIAGREGIGKSLLLTWLTAEITRGTLPGVYSGTPRSVFYCATEDSWQHTIVPRLIAAGADLDRVYRVEVEAVEASTGDGMLVELTMPRDCDLLGAEVKQLEVALVALDPLMSAIDRKVDTYNDRDMRTVLEPLARLADRAGCMVVGLGHFNKSASDDPLNLITGSRAFTAVVRAVLAAARDPEADDDSCVLSQVKNNLGKLNLPNLTYAVREAIVETPEGDARVGRLHFTGESQRSVRDILADLGSASERTERAECAEWLRQKLSAGPQRSREVEQEAMQHGYSKRTYERARQLIRVKPEQLATGAKGRSEWWIALPGQAGRHDTD